MDEPVMDYMRRYRFKKLLLLDDADTGLRAVIAIHSTALGPAGGGATPTSIVPWPRLQTSYRPRVAEHPCSATVLQPAWLRGADLAAFVRAFDVLPESILHCDCALISYRGRSMSVEAYGDRVGNLAGRQAGIRQK